MGENSNDHHLRLHFKIIHNNNLAFSVFMSSQYKCVQFLSEDSTDEQTIIDLNFTYYPQQTAHHRITGQTMNCY